MNKEKSTNQSPITRNYFLLSVFLISLFALQSFWHAKDKSSTIDEGTHLTVSYLLCKTGQLDYDFNHTPFIRYLFAIPLLWMNPSLPSQMQPPALPRSVPLVDQRASAIFLYSEIFLYDTNRASAEKMLLASRVVNILLGCLLGYWIFKWSKKCYGDRAGIFSLGLFALCPNLIAHSSLVTTDVGGVTFAVGFLYSLTILMERNTVKWILFSGFLLGAALLSKFTNIFLIPLFILSSFFLNKIQDRNYRAIFKTTAAVLFVGWFVLCAGYKFQGLFSTHSLQEEDWKYLGYGKTVQTLYRFAPLPDSFMRGIVSVVHHSKRDHPAYLLGNHSVLGWWYYFPMAFFLKTPSVTLMLLIVWLFLLIKKRIPLTRTEALIIFPMIFYFGMAMMGHINIGIRHILICYPLLYVLFGKIACFLLPGSLKSMVLSGMIFYFLAAEVFSVSPHYLAFFNRIAGGPAKGIEYLSDSNIDWGQDLKNLSKFLKDEGNPELILCYFGVVSPEFYGIQYQGVVRRWSYHLNSASPEKEYLAVSVSDLQDISFKGKNLFGWLKNKEPLKKVGFSIYVYDVTTDLESQKELLRLYQMAGEKEMVLRQVDRIKNLSRSLNAIEIYPG